MKEEKKKLVTTLSSLPMTWMQTLLSEGEIKVMAAASPEDHGQYKGEFFPVHPITRMRISFSLRSSLKS